MNTVQPIGALLEGFFSKYTKLQYKKGEIVLRAGDPPSGALYLKSGLVRMSFATDTGDMLVLHVFKEGSVFPMPWIVNEEPNRYYYETLTPVEIWRAPREDITRLFSDQPSIEHDMLERMHRGLNGLMKRMEFLVFDSAYKKTILLLLYYVKNFSDDKVKGKLLIPLTHREIAAWIGTTRETASLQIETLKKKKLIEYHRRYILIPDVEMLENEIAV